MQTLRWHLSGPTVSEYPNLRKRFSPLDGHRDGESQCFVPDLEELVSRSASNWPSPELLKRSKSEGWKMGMVL